MDKLRHILHDSRIVGINTDSPKILDAHRSVLAQKPMMQKVFGEFYRQLILARDKYFTATGDELELGAGISLFKEARPQIMTSDIKSTPHCDYVIDAQDMAMDDNSLAAIYGINCFHHFPDPDKFFNELQRVLKPGGGAILIEPYHGPFSSLLYRNVHDNEHFNKSQIDWKTEGMGSMTGANQALSYMVFERDRSKFMERYPELEIVETTRFNNYMEYLLSGGLNFRQMVPTVAVPLIKFLQGLLTPASHLFALHQMIVIRRRT